MNANEAVVRSADAAKRAIVYEQPLNERMRNFLRLDFLYPQAVHHHTKSDPWSTRAAVHGLLEILAITQRGDVRGEVLKELERQMALLATYTTRPGVDTVRLRMLLTKLHRMREELSNVGALFMQKLRDSEFGERRRAGHHGGREPGRLRRPSPSVGLNIQLPHEQRANPYQDISPHFRPTSSPAR